MDKHAADQKTRRTSFHRFWIGLVVSYLLIPVVLMVSGGDPRWWQGWTYSALIFAGGVAGRVLAEYRHPGLMEERTNLKAMSNVMPGDKVLSILMSLSVSFPLYIVAGLDHRHHWSPVFPIWLNLLGLLFCAVGFSLAVWALVENRYFSSVVRIQKDRGHVVCDTGPYRIIRHPGYTGNILPLPGIVLALSSVWTLIPAAAALIIAILRTAREDQFLQMELPGYREYASRVRYRLFPWVY